MLTFVKYLFHNNVVASLMPITTYLYINLRGNIVDSSWMVLFTNI
jgi:hypothetical protein